MRNKMFYLSLNYFIVLVFNRWINIVFWFFYEKEENNINGNKIDIYIR